jgi:hypothetical protein
LEVTLPGERSFFNVGVGERLERMASAVVGNFTFEELASFNDGFPKISGPPGLRAVVTPDGVTALVLRGGEGPVDVARIIVLDMVDRYVRPRLAEMAASGLSPEEVGIAVIRLARSLQSRYRIERLGEVASERSCT